MALARVIDPMTGKKDREASGIKCDCGSTNIRVVDSRPAVFNGEGSVFRSRKCQSCGQKWSTYEVTETQVQMVFRKTVTRIMSELMERI